MTRPIQDKKRGKSSLQPLGQILFDYAIEDKGGYITKEFQDYGYRMAMELSDLSNKSLYIKLAKDVPRPILEKAMAVVKESTKVKHKGKLFMWALAKLRKGENIYDKKGEK